MNIIEAKEAVKTAKTHLEQIYLDESLSNIGLEEVEFDGSLKLWNVTLGFSRPWNQPNNAITAALSNPRRTYKIVCVRTNGDIESIKNRD